MRKSDKSNFKENKERDVKLIIHFGKFFFFLHYLMFAFIHYFFPKLKQIPGSNTSCFLHIIIPY